LVLEVEGISEDVKANFIQLNKETFDAIENFKYEANDWAEESQPDDNVHIKPIPVNKTDSISKNHTQH
jgi:hypothetical protein